MSNKVDGLFKSGLKSSKPADNTRFIYSKRKINGICNSLTTETNAYNVDKTIRSIITYLAESQKLERILYSEISNYVFSLDMTERGIFATNIEKLLLFSLDDANGVEGDCKKIIVKIYDHFQLALHQIENANIIFANSINEVKINFKKEIKVIEKEYISILGIFAAIVLAFVGGITFSSSVLQNISNVSIYRLILIVDLLAIVLINVMHLLVKLIFTINEKNTKEISVKWINIACLIVALITIISWLLNFTELPNFIRSYLPWG